MPILSKKAIQEAPQLFRRKQKPQRKLQTAGSTGEPLQFGAWNSEAILAGANIDAMRWYRGMNLRQDRLFLIWGHAHLLGTGTSGRIRGWKRKFKDALLGYYRVNAYNIGRNAARGYFDSLLQSRAKVLCGYSNAIDLFVRHNHDRFQLARDLNLRFIICTSEMLPRADSREIIETFFDAPVMMEYGGVEFGVVAHNWRNSPYQINWWDYFAESIPPASSEGGARLILTALYPRYLPLVRYDAGDEVAGPKLGTDDQVIEFDQLLGRKNDVLQFDDGSVVHSVGLFHCIQQEPLIANIQLILGENNMQIRLIGTPEEKTTNRIRRRLADLHPKLASCGIEYTDDLVTTAAGKRRWIIDKRSKCP